MSEWHDRRARQIELLLKRGRAAAKLTGKDYKLYGNGQGVFLSRATCEVPCGSHLICTVHPNGSKTMAPTPEDSSDGAT